jgi:hypothetical protein
MDFRPDEEDTFWKERTRYHKFGENDGEKDFGKILEDFNDTESGGVYHGGTCEGEIE